MRLSWQLAPLSVTPSGVPRASTTMWRLVPGLPLSVGLGPVASPLFWQTRWRCRAPHATSPAPWRRGAFPVARDAVPPRCLPPATRQAVASSSFRCSPALSGAHASTACRCAAPAEYPPAQRGSTTVADRPSASTAQVAEAARSPPKDRRKQERPSPCNPLVAGLSLVLALLEHFGIRGQPEALLAVRALHRHEAAGE